MTREEAIATVTQVMIEQNRQPDKPGVTFVWAEGLVATLIALEILKVDDGKEVE